MVQAMVPVTLGVVPPTVADTRQVVLTGMPLTTFASGFKPPPEEIALGVASSKTAAEVIAVKYWPEPGSLFWIENVVEGVPVCED